MARLANPFEQVENVMTRAKKGSGLGLAITKALIELHGGEFAITSRLGESTLVTVCLPRSPGPTNGRTKAAERNELPASGA